MELGRLREAVARRDADEAAAGATTPATEALPPDAEPEDAARERLLSEVWGWADASGTRAVDSHVKALRRKLGADRIRTVHGVGYALEARP